MIIWLIKLSLNECCSREIQPRSCTRRVRTWSRSSPETPSGSRPRRNYSSNHRPPDLPMVLVFMQRTQLMAWWTQTMVYVFQHGIGYNYVLFSYPTGIIWKRDSLCLRNYSLQCRRPHFVEIRLYVYPVYSADYCENLIKRVPTWKKMFYVSVFGSGCRSGALGCLGPDLCKDIQNIIKCIFQIILQTLIFVFILWWTRRAPIDDLDPESETGSGSE